MSFDKAVDVYAFGVTAIALLAQKMPMALMREPPIPVSLSTLRASMVGLQPEVISIIHQCLRKYPDDRPSMESVRDTLAKRLLENQHRALVAMVNKEYSLDQRNRKIVLTADNVGSLTIEYNGFEFKATSATGAIYLNNAPVQVGSSVPGCCVITFGDGTTRLFVTFDVSHPEVVP